ncbi:MULTISPECIES: PH domain-containing protein [Sporosarcina]|uniref:PH domain-containing protein n=1 Tax=Sporosarcina TaxID=1569 RepID=UPI00058FD806|nr:MULTISPECIES: PH domain-containing protein [Sporosarcina]WJY27169.1 PH domain-containing protein [Sporosarcina sp. 0.2-SM1T-5]
MSERHYKLHWVTVLVETLKAVKDAILPLLVVLFTGSRNNDTGNWFLDNWSLLFGGGLALFLILSGLIKWLRFSYWFEDGELRIESGLFVKKKRYIPFERIQSLNYTEGIFHRPFGLVKVEVETAASGSGESEAELTAVTREDADRIKQRIAAGKRKQVEDGETELSEDRETAEEEGEQIFAMTPKQLIILATTSSGIGVIFSGAALFLSQFGEFLPIDKVSAELAGLLKFGVLLIGLLVLAALLGAWVLSIAMTFFSYYGFKARVVEDELIITRGLIEKKRTTIPLSRIQSVSLQENPLRQLFGYARVVVHSAGAAGDGSRIQLFPLVKKKEVYGPLQEIFPELDLRDPVQKLPKRGRKFYYRIDFFWMVPIAALISWFFYPYGLWSLLIFPIVMAFGLWQHRSAAWRITGNQATIRSRSFGLDTSYTMRRRIQSAEVRQTIFQKRKDVATIHLNVKSGMGVHRVGIRQMEHIEAERMLEWYDPEPGTGESGDPAGRPLDPAWRS